jgi:hypothetical protein
MILTTNRHSGLLCLDFDHLNNVQILFEQLLNDDYFETQLLFRSPSGDGLKWVISVDADPSEHTGFSLPLPITFIKLTASLWINRGATYPAPASSHTIPTPTSIPYIILQPVNGIAATIFPEVTFQLSTFHFHFEAGAVLICFADFFMAR